MMRPPSRRFMDRAGMDSWFSYSWVVRRVDFCFRALVS